MAGLFPQTLRTKTFYLIVLGSCGRDASRTALCAWPSFGTGGGRTARRLSFGLFTRYSEIDESCHQEGGFWKEGRVLDEPHCPFTIRTLRREPRRQQSDQTSRQRVRLRVSRTMVARWPMDHLHKRTSRRRQLRHLPSSNERHWVGEARGFTCDGGCRSAIT